MAGITGITKSAFKKMGGLGTAVSLGVNAYIGINSYSEAKREGSSTIGAAAKTVADIALSEVIGWPVYLGAKALIGAPGFIVRGYESMARTARSMSATSNNIPFANATFVDTQQIYTMRQAGMALAQQSKYNLQHAMLGNEAQYLHR